MSPRAPRFHRWLGLLAAALSIVFAPVPRSEPVMGQAPVGIAIHGTEETLRDFCVEQDGALWLVLPNGSRHELVTSTTDPAITNPGDGSFHPFDEATILTAMAALRAPLAPLRV